MAAQTELVPQTVIAVRSSPASSWRMLGLRCALNELPQRLPEVAPAGSEVRFVDASRVAPDRWEQCLYGAAARRGWTYVGNIWHPIEESLPPMGGEAPSANIALVLRSVLCGSIVVEVKAGEQSVRLGFDDMHDSPVLLVRFIQLLLGGGQPHAALADYSSSYVGVQNCSAADLCRLYVRSFFQQEERVLDLTTNRSRLEAEFRRLAHEIGTHPNLAQHFLYHGCLSDKAYERAHDEAEREWDEGVKQGLFADGYDEREEFVASRLVANVPLPPEYAEEALQYRTMMCSLEIPRYLQMRFGLRSLSGPDDIATLIDRYSSIGW